MGGFCQNASRFKSRLEMALRELVNRTLEFREDRWERDSELFRAVEAFYGICPSCTLGVGGRLGRETS